ncbi:hypothetical protein [Halomicrobium urmianum]|uniref:hypothetical protein n=1 Tax=Halomicrobium urmianum TaxID=1586233 RepID=UPI001CD96175|nr:hypothetical protein [Halomicrobium urmianum]
MTAPSDGASAGTTAPIPGLAAVAGLVALATSVTRRVSPLVLEIAPDAASPQVLTQATLGGRFAAFALTYGVLFGVAYRAGKHSGDPDGDVRAAAVAGATAATAFVAGSAAAVFALGARQNPLVGVAVTAGSGVAVGVRLAVVAFAGLALARR